MNGSKPVGDTPTVEPYVDPLPYLACALGVAITGVVVALSTSKLTAIVAGSIIALIGVSVFDQLVAYDAAHPQGSKRNPKIHNYFVYGVGGGVVKTILIITAITIKILVVI